MITKQEIKNSLDAKWRLKQIFLYCGLSIFIIIVLGVEMLFSISDVTDKEISKSIISVLFTTTIFISLIFIIPLMYQLFQYFRLFKDIDKYGKYEVVLDHPEVSYMYRHSVYYNIELTTKTGNRVQLDTLPMFSSFSMNCSLEDYNNKTVYLLYNEEKEKMCILGLK